MFQFPLSYQTVRFPNFPQSIKSDEPTDKEHREKSNKSPQAVITEFPPISVSRRTKSLQNFNRNNGKSTQNLNPDLNYATENLQLKLSLKKLWTGTTSELNMVNRPLSWGMPPLKLPNYDCDAILE